MDEYCSLYLLFFRDYLEKLATNGNFETLTSGHYSWLSLGILKPSEIFDMY